MAKKTLNEAVVRRFQKLANVAPINEMYGKYEEDYMNEEEEAEEGGEDLAPAADADAGMADMDADADADAEMDGDLELTDEEAEAIIALGAKLEAAMGMDDEMGDMDMGGEEADMGGDEDLGSEEDLMEALRGISYVPSQGEIVNEVAQRVARRLKAAKLHEAKLNKALGKRR